MATTAVLLSLCAFVALGWHAEATISFSRKPILNYLIRYKLGQLRAAKAHAHQLGVSVIAKPGAEEHYHHYYIEPFPYDATPLGPPVILDGGHFGHTHFSLYSPHIDAELKYHNYWDLHHKHSL